MQSIRCLAIPSETKKKVHKFNFHNLSGFAYLPREDESEGMESEYDELRIEIERWRELEAKNDHSSICGKIRIRAEEREKKIDFWQWSVAGGHLSHEGAWRGHASSLQRTTTNEFPTSELSSFIRACGNHRWERRNDFHVHVCHATDKRADAPIRINSKCNFETGDDVNHQLTQWNLTERFDYSNGAYNLLLWCMWKEILMSVLMVCNFVGSVPELTYSYVVSVFSSHGENRNAKFQHQ
ncbi:hypothetical protein VNO77_24564 [Canavalia gladiata]|uniref:Uncharacterized protein n=1 Tax=Canavalia gladiata TaxID=3824 RepID=A0AAN9L7V6_CANGL